MKPAKLAKLMSRHRHGVDTQDGMYVTVEFELWRDTPRKWKFVTTDTGGYAQVEDK